MKEEEEEKKKSKYYTRIANVVKVLHFMLRNE